MRRFGDGTGGGVVVGVGVHVGVFGGEDGLTRVIEIEKECGDG